MIIMLVAVGILFGLIIVSKTSMNNQTKKLLINRLNQPVAVTTGEVKSVLWQPTIKAVGSLRTKTGVNVTTELPGMVQTIYFTPGSIVEKGTVLVQLNADSEIALLHSLQAQVELAKITYERDKAQYAIRGVSKQIVDSDEWTLKKLQAQVDEQAAIVAKKTIRAPFTGRLGINLVNPGQYLNVGETVTNLQALDPIYADFNLPQQNLARLEIGQTVTVFTDVYPRSTFQGRITTIQPLVDTATRNVLVEATLANPESKLKPGMFINVEVITGKPKEYLYLPQTAISFNPYGDLVYLVKDMGKKDENQQPVLVVEQVFVTVGESRGNEIAILKGLKLGDTVVTSGQLKLRNGSRIIVVNSK